MTGDPRKDSGSYYTPEDVVRSLVAWVVRKPSDRLLDPSCGDGRFLVVHPNSVGVEQDAVAASIVHQRAPGCLIHQGDFFSWATETSERFECAAGNPPFIRYQRFSGSVRATALDLCARHGAQFSSLSSSWAPFLVAAATLLKPNGRMAFVVPAEIGHAPYAAPVLEYFTAHFSRVQIIAVRRKLFPDLSEDCWLLYADGHGGRTENLEFSAMEQFGFLRSPPSLAANVSMNAWRRRGRRLRPFLAGREVLRTYDGLANAPDAFRLGAVARVGIGYVTGANEFFHLRPSEAHLYGIQDGFLVPAVRNGRSISGSAVTKQLVQRWHNADEPMLLLRVQPNKPLSREVRAYLETPAAYEAKQSYKCRTRDPWYAVPDVTIPDGFMSYMSGEGPALVANAAGCAGTNSVHVVKLNGQTSMRTLLRAWKSPLRELSAELEGHPLGGGMLKLEPREAGRTLMLRRSTSITRKDLRQIREGIDAMRRWRHHE